MAGSTRSEEVIAVTSARFRCNGRCEASYSGGQDHTLVSHFLQRFDLTYDEASLHRLQSVTAARHCC